MSVCLSGVRARPSVGLAHHPAEDQPRSLYVHCANHSLDLALQEEAKRAGIVANPLNIITEVTSILKIRKRKRSRSRRRRCRNWCQEGSHSPSAFSLPYTMDCSLSIDPPIPRVLKTLADVRRDRSATPSEIRYETTFQSVLLRSETLLHVCV